jgi:hypothetical protein
MTSSVDRPPRITRKGLLRQARPPYDVHELVPTMAFGFGLDETFTLTRWRFRREGDDE